MKCQSCQTLSASYTSWVFDKCLWHQRKGFHRMPFCLMTLTASSLKRLSNGAESGEHLLFQMVSQYQRSDSPTAAWTTHYNINPRKFILEYFINRMWKSKMSNSNESCTRRSEWVSGKLHCRRKKKKIIIIHRHRNLKNSWALKIQALMVLR